MLCACTPAILQRLPAKENTLLFTDSTSTQRRFKRFRVTAILNYCLRDGKSVKEHLITHRDCNCLSFRAPLTDHHYLRFAFRLWHSDGKKQLNGGHNGVIAKRYMRGWKSFFGPESQPRWDTTNDAPYDFSDHPIVKLRAPVNWHVPPSNSLGLAYTTPHHLLDALPPFLNWAQPDPQLPDAPSNHSAGLSARLMPVRRLAVSNTSLCDHLISARFPRFESGSQAALQSPHGLHPVHPPYKAKRSVIIILSPIWGWESTIDVHSLPPSLFSRTNVPEEMVVDVLTQERRCPGFKWLEFQDDGTEMDTPIVVPQDKHVVCTVHDWVSLATPRCR